MENELEMLRVAEAVEKMKEQPNTKLTANI
jgi:hypothetical protein